MNDCRSRPGTGVVKKLGMVFILGSVAAVSAQQVSNVSAKVASNGYSAIINYDLTSTQLPAYHVSLYYSLDNGSTFNPVSDTATGAIGANIQTGVGKQITWPDFAYVLSKNGGQQAVFRVAAQLGEEQFTVQFTDLLTSATEGQGTAMLKVVASNHFVGKIRYSVTAMTNVTIGSISSGADIAPLAGEVMMLDGNAEIPVVIHDDKIIETPKALSVDLVYDERLGYKLGSQFRQMMALYDDDAYWNGTMMGNGSSDGESPIRMRITRKNGQIEGSLVSEADSTIGGNALPVGDWPLLISWDGTTFSATNKTAIPVEATSLFPDSSALHRDITFTADTSTTAGLVKWGSLIQGQFSEGLRGGPGMAYLNSDTIGGFALTEEVAPFVPPAAPVLPVPDSIGSGAGLGSTGDVVLSLKGSDDQ